MPKTLDFIKKNEKKVLTLAKSSRTIMERLMIEHYLRLDSEDQLRLYKAYRNLLRKYKWLIEKNKVT